MEDDEVDESDISDFEVRFMGEKLSFGRGREVLVTHSR